MKKLLGFILVLLLTNNVYAGIISYDSLSGDAGVSYTHFNNSFSTIYNEFNGGITDANITADTFTERVFADSANPRVRDYEFFGDYTYTGMLPVTSASLTSNIGSGTSYVSGYRIVTDATSKTYTASKDTYVYIDKNGAFQYSEVANGATAPTTPSDSLLLAKVVTNGTAITSVTDLRRLTPTNVRVYLDLKTGAVVSRDITTATKISIDRGEIEFGVGTGGVRRNTTPAYIDFTTTGYGGLDTGSLAAGTYYYLYAVPDADNSTSFEGIASTSISGASGVDNERLIGWVYASGTSALSPDSCGAYRGRGGDAPNIVMRSWKATTTELAVDDTTYGADLDSTSTKFYASGRPVLIQGLIKSRRTDANPYHQAVIYVDNVSKDVSEVGGSAASNNYYLELTPRWMGALSPGTHDIKMSMKIDAGGTNNTVNSWNLIIEEK